MCLFLRLSFSKNLGNVSYIFNFGSVCYMFSKKQQSLGVWNKIEKKLAIDTSSFVGDYVQNVLEYILSVISFITSQSINDKWRFVCYKTIYYL